MRINSQFRSSQSGEDREENQITLCAACNSSAHSRDHREYDEEIHKMTAHVGAGRIMHSSLLQCSYVLCFVS